MLSFNPKIKCEIKSCITKQLDESWGKSRGGCSPLNFFSLKRLKSTVNTVKSTVVA